MFIAAALPTGLRTYDTPACILLRRVLARANLIGMCLRAVAAGQGNG